MRTLLRSRGCATSSTSTLAFAGLDSTASPERFKRCSRRRRSAMMRSSVEALGRWRRDRMSRKALRRRCEASASGVVVVVVVGSSALGVVESWEVTGRRSTRLGGC